MRILEEATKEAAEKGRLPKGLSEFTCLRRNVVATSEERENMQTDPNDADNLHCRLREKGFSNMAVSVCGRCRIKYYDQVLDIWEAAGVSGLEEKIRNPNQRRKDATVKEIIIKLAFSSIDTSDKLKEHIRKLIDEDAKYSEVRFWKAFRTVLKFLPEKKYVKLKKDELQRFSESYRYVVEKILEERYRTVGSILPEEDYFEVVCPECDYATSFSFIEIYSTSCRFCDIKNIADEKGFDMYTREECEDKDFEEEMEETDCAFVCKLCQSVCLITNIDSVGVYGVVKGLKCEECVGERYLTWLADNSVYSIEIEDDCVYFMDPKDNRRTKLEKEELRPERILDSITFIKDLKEEMKAVEE